MVSAKSDGVTPGFVIEDEQDNRYLLKLDSPEYPELASAADMIGSKFFYALGYNTPENYIVRFHREKLVVSDGAFWRDSSGVKRPITRPRARRLLKAQPTGPDGSYRALASRWIAGKLLGPFTYEGTRTDDPNDTIPHEDRRVLRGLRVFAAWLNHQDTRSMNTMDTLVTERRHPACKALPDGLRFHSGKQCYNAEGCVVGKSIRHREQGSTGADRDAWVLRPQMGASGDTHHQGRWILQRRRIRSDFLEAHLPQPRLSADGPRRRVLGGKAGCCLQRSRDSSHRRDGRIQ